jgi:Rod binding domain-containing protein
MNTLATIGAVPSTPASSVTSTVDPKTVQKIKSHAVEFESMLIRQMMRELRQSPFKPEVRSDSKSYLEMGDEQFAKNLAQSGGFGFGKAMADLMLKQIHTSGLIAGAEKSVKTVVSPNF